VIPQAAQVMINENKFKKMKKLLTVLFLVAFVSLQAQEKDHKMAEGLIVNQDIFNTSMQEGVSCYRIPAIETAPNGDLIAAIDERVPSCGDLKWSKDINIVLRRSADNGQTWSAIETVVDFPLGQSASDPSLIVDRVTNEIFLFYNYMDLDKEKDVYYLHLVSSKDNGKTWSEPRDITTQIALPGWKKDFKFITSGRGIQLRDGTLLHTMVNLDNGGHVFGSDDHGKTWYLINNSIRPFNESKIVELTNGDWMINSRVQGLGYRYVHISKDRGASWHSYGDTTLIDPACNASIIRYTSLEDGYKKNRLLFSNAKRKKGRMNMTVRISYDEGKTWSEGKTIYTGGSAYSSMTILKNGDIGLFFEKDGHKANPFVSFSLEWLTDGKDKYKKPKKK
jgi:sialidase-1